MSKNTNHLTVRYPAQERTLTIEYMPTFPYQITGWEETYMDGFGAGRKQLATRAVRDKTLFIDYWRYHSNSDIALRDSLNLPNCP